MTGISRRGHKNMIRNTKSIKRIKLLYDNIEESKEVIKVETKIDTPDYKKGESIPLISKTETEDNINTKYIRNDVIKTFVFVIFAIAILYLAHRFNLFAMIFVK